MGIQWHQVFEDALRRAEVVAVAWVTAMYLDPSTDAPNCRLYAEPLRTLGCTPSREQLCPGEQRSGAAHPGRYLL